MGLADLGWTQQGRASASVFRSVGLVSRLWVLFKSAPQVSHYSGPRNPWGHDFMAMAKVEVGLCSPHACTYPIAQSESHDQAQGQGKCALRLVGGTALSHGQVWGSILTPAPISHTTRGFHIFIGFCLEGFSYHCNINFMQAGISFVLYPVLYLAPKTAAFQQLYICWLNV